MRAFLQGNALFLLITGFVLAAPGCQKAAPKTQAGPPPADPESAKVATEIGDGLTDLINEANTRFSPLDYDYDEDLLKMMDQFEAHLSGKAAEPAPRFMPKLEQKEETEHLRETIRRWESKTGKSLRSEIDPLVAEVAARKPGDPPFHPAFHKRFSAVFDDFIGIEVAEIRERRNRYLHQRAEQLFEKYRASHPDVVREQGAFLDQPPYNLPVTTDSSG